jgi:biopolymer transport protein ExbD
MARKKKDRNKGDEVKLEMTPMIDVVFQLLIFFIVTLKQEDILSQLEVLRPAPDTNTTPETQIEPITILVGRTGFVYRGRPVTESELNSSIARVAKYNTNAMVMVKCTLDSDHRWLVKALDICSRNNMTKLSVFSM